MRGRRSLAASRPPLRGSLALSLVLGACTCDASAPEERPPPALQAPEPWTLGAADGEGVVLPPPCIPAGDRLAAVMARAVRLQAVPGLLDHVVAVEGTLAPTRGRPAWSPDAAGVMPLTHGRVETAVVLPWSPAARAARLGDAWLVALDRGSVSIWQDGSEIFVGRDESVIDFRCGKDRCALLTEADRPRLRLGPPWETVDLPAGQRALAIAGVGDRIVATTVDDVRVRFFSATLEEVEEIAALEAQPGALAALVDPPAALVRRGFDERGCRQEAGGVDLVTSRGALPLRSALPPEEAALVSLGGGGLLAAWLSPVRCGATARVLHAAVIAPDGRLAGPVTTVGEVDGFALASAGARVSLWIERRTAAAGRGTVTFLPMRCATGGEP